MEENTLNLVKKLRKFIGEEIFSEEITVIEGVRVNKYRLNTRIKGDWNQEIKDISMFMDQFCLFQNKQLISFKLPKFVPVESNKGKLAVNKVTVHNRSILEHLLQSKAKEGTKLIEQRILDFEGETLQLTYSEFFGKLVCYTGERLFLVNKQSTSSFAKFLLDGFENNKSVLPILIKLLKNTVIVGKFISNKGIFTYKDSEIPVFLVSYALNKSDLTLTRLTEIEAVLSKIKIFLSPRTEEECIQNSETQGNRLKLDFRQGCKAILILITDQQNVLQQHYKVYSREYICLKQIKIAFRKEKIGISGCLEGVEQEFDCEPEDKVFFKEIVDRLNRSVFSPKIALKQALEYISDSKLTNCYIFEKNEEIDDTDKQTTKVEDYEKLLLAQSNKLMSLRNQVSQKNEMVLF